MLERGEWDERDGVLSGFDDGMIYYWQADIGRRVVEHYPDLWQRLVVTANRYFVRAEHRKRTDLHLEGR